MGRLSTPGVAGRVAGSLLDVPGAIAPNRQRRGSLAREPIEFFVGSGKQDDQAVMAGLRAHVGEEPAEADGDRRIPQEGGPIPRRRSPPIR